MKNQPTFTGNVRSATRLDDTALRESMRGGWEPELPAIKDENGVVVVGHRRLAVAAELGIAPVIKTVTFGSGPEADAQRERLACVSNVGGEPMTREERKREAERLYDGGNGLTIEAIAHMLGVAKGTISKDLAEIVSVETIKPRAKTATNPKGAGRPKSSRKSRQRKNPPTAEQYAAQLVLDQGKTMAQAAAATGVGSVQVVKTAIAREEGRREALAEPEIDRASLSMSAQQKLDAAIRQHERKLDLQFKERVRVTVLKKINEYWLPDHKKQLAEAERVLKKRRGIWKKSVYKLIRDCLHTDRVRQLVGHTLDPGTAKKYDEAFGIVVKDEKLLLDEADSPTQTLGLPETFEEVMAAARGNRKREPSARSVKRC